MKKINLYLTEKFKISKDIDSSNNIKEDIKNVIKNYLEGFLHFKFKEDYLINAYSKAGWISIKINYPLSSEDTLNGIIDKLEEKISKVTKVIKHNKMYLKKGSIISINYEEN